MKGPRVVHAAVRAALMMALMTGPALAQADGNKTDFDTARVAFGRGDNAAALAAVERVLTRSPDDLDALYWSGLFNFYQANLDAARGRLERLVKDSGNYAAAWEAMVMVTQAQGDLRRRNEALDRLKLAIRSAIDPAIRRKSDIVRDRIPAGGDSITGIEYFGRGGSDFTRFQFSFGDPRTQPDLGLLVRTDAITTETWSATALLPMDKQLFHLDLVENQDGGGQKVAIYEYYVGEPDYDKVRAKVLEILRGEAKPLSGQPGRLAGILGK